VLHPWWLSAATDAEFRISARRLASKASTERCASSRSDIVLDGRLPALEEELDNKGTQLEGESLA